MRQHWRGERSGSSYGAEQARCHLSFCCAAIPLPCCCLPCLLLSVCCQPCACRRPVLTQMATSSVLWAAGDALAQRCSSKSLDARRVAMTAVFAGLIIGPSGHAWYSSLDKLSAVCGPIGASRNVVITTASQHWHACDPRLLTPSRASQPPANLQALHFTSPPAHHLQAQLGTCLRSLWLTPHCGIGGR